jgi:hypothetical protein
MPRYVFTVLDADLAERERSRIVSKAKPLNDGAATECGAEW